MADQIYKQSEQKKKKKFKGMKTMNAPLPSPDRRVFSFALLE